MFINSHTYVNFSLQSTPKSEHIPSTLLQPRTMHRTHSKLLSVIPKKKDFTHHKGLPFLLPSVPLSWRVQCYNWAQRKIHPVGASDPASRFRYKCPYLKQSSVTTIHGRYTTKKNTPGAEQFTLQRRGCPCSALFNSSIRRVRVWV